MDKDNYHEMYMQYYIKKYLMSQRFGQGTEDAQKIEYEITSQAMPLNKEKNSPLLPDNNG